MSQVPDLLEKRAAYESLSNHLTQLPRKLTHPGLIPIAPRLYLPGQLIRTNEILVLLGRSGESSYFAERTAWQAHQIVRRRLGHVEQGLRELLDGIGEVTVTKRPSSRSKKRVTFREPVVCASSPLESRPRPNTTSFDHSCAKDIFEGNGEIPSRAADMTTTGRVYASLDHNSSTTCEDPAVEQSSNEQPSGKADSPRNPNQFRNPVANIPQEYIDVLRAAELDEDSSDDDTEGEYASSLGDDYGQFMSKSPHAKEASRLSVPLEHSCESEIDKVSSNVSGPEDIERRSKPRDDRRDSARERKRESEQNNVKLEFQDALRNAEKQALEGGVVNLTEFYEEGSALPSRVTLLPHFQPDESINFDDDAEEYLDITGGSAKAASNKASGTDNYLEFLREEARKEEEEEHRRVAEKNLSASDAGRKRLEREKKEFGTGFAKGFFGAPSKRSSVLKKNDCDAFPAPQVRNPEVSEIQETGAVEERVVERKASRKSSRRHRKPRATVMPEVISVAASQQEPNTGEDERAGRFARIENPAETDDSQMSKFRQLRQLKRFSADKNTNR